MIKKKYAYAFATSAARSGRINVIQVLTPFIGIVNTRISSSLSTSLQPQTITSVNNKKTEILSEQAEAIRILLPIMKNTSRDFGFGFRHPLRWQEKDGDLLSQ